jgi:RES domain-containing protein
MDRNLALAVSRCGTTSIKGEFQRHVSMKVRPLTGSRAGGRWGAMGAYPVLYVGRPEASVIVEAYRHLVDDVEGMRPDAVQPRLLLTIAIDMTNVVDLRVPANQEIVGLTPADLRSSVGDYDNCQRVGQAAHQLGVHGIIAPAATGMGDTLAVFELHLPANEQPHVLSEETWAELPPDPRVPRLVEHEREDEAP